MMYPQEHRVGDLIAAHKEYTKEYLLGWIVDCYDIEYPPELGYAVEWADGRKRYYTTIEINGYKDFLKRIQNES